MQQQLDIESMRQAHSDEEIVRELYTLFKDELPLYKTQIESFAKDKNSKGLYDITHKLHGSCCYCHAPHLKEIVTLVENEAQQDKINPQLVKDLGRLIEAVTKEIDVYLQNK